MRQLKYSVLTFVGMLSLPVQAFAHGTEEEHSSEVLTSSITYGVWISLVVLGAFILLFFWSKQKASKLNVKKAEGQAKRDKLAKISKVSLIISAIAVISTIGFGIMSANQGSNNEVAFEHIHGLDYKSDGKEIYVPAHDGLRVYKDGEWMIPEGERNDYMGFSMVEDGFYSSGHPGPGSKLENPLGIVKSKDYGKSIDILGLYKEEDFHGMTVGYQTKDIYVFNPKPNSKMSEAGFYYSTDDAKTWNKAKFEGIVDQPSSLAAHPIEKGVVAIGTATGVYISKDYGNKFELLLSYDDVTSISFTNDNALLAGGGNGKASLAKVDLNTKEQTEIPIPTLEKDSIAYVKQNPVNKDELVFSTFEKDIYLSKDNGIKWKKIVDKGIALNPTK